MLFRRSPNAGEPRLSRKAQGLIKSLQFRDMVADENGELVDLGTSRRRSAVVKLGYLDGRQIADALTDSALKDGDPLVRQLAGTALARILGRSYQRTLTMGSADPRPSVPESEENLIGPGEVGRRFLLVADDDLIDEHQQLLHSVFGGASEDGLGPVIVAELAETLDDPSPAVVDRAIGLIARYASGPLDPLIAALEDPARTVAAARALGEVRDNRALGVLISHLSAPDVAVRRACVWALGEISDSRAVAALVSATSDDAYDVRSEALRALEKLGAVGVIGGVATALSAGAEMSANSRRTWTPDDYLSAMERIPPGRDESASSEAQSEPTVADLFGAGSAFAQETGVDDSLLSALSPSKTAVVSASDGTLLHTEVYGSTGPTIVLIHGWSTALRLWTPVLTGLTDQFRVIAYDLRGHGRSSPAQSGGYSLETLGDDLEAVLAASVEEGNRVILIGHSLGASSIVAWARRRDVAQKVSAAMLMHVGFGDLVAETLLARLAAPDPTDRLRASPPEASSAREAVIRELVFGSNVRQAQLAFYEQMMLECSREALSQTDIAFPETEARDALSRLVVPTIVVSGELDKLASPEQAHSIAGMLPNLQALIELPQVGHAGPLERPDQIIRLVRKLAADVGQSAST
jgi:pimeloyl-ACP methyl ester carboxylesterase